MAETIKEKIAKIEKALDAYKGGSEPLPITVNDIYFIIGACSELIQNVKNLESSYKSDFIRLNEDLEKFRNKWKEARQIASNLNMKIHRLTAVMTHVKNLSWWRKSKALKKELQLLKEFDRKEKKLTLPDT